MLLIASEAAKRTPSVLDLAREMSLTLTCFASAATLAGLMSGQSRRIVLLTDDDVNDAVIASLEHAAAAIDFGLIIAADREALRSGNAAKLLEQLADFDNVEWVESAFDYDKLAVAARGCRLRMLRISREELEAAIHEDQFVVQYQPKVRVQGEAEWQTCEAEALLRWRHPQHGMMGPLEFLPEVEAFGMSDAVSEIVLREACSQLARWHERGLDLNVCINLASSLLAGPALPAEYAAIVDEYNLDCSNVTFEIAEQDLYDPEAPHLRAFNELRQQGFRICLDDFRVATGSLGAFGELPFDEIKIHASAIKHAQSDSVALHVLAAITGLAHNLGMSVCAEGVEDQDTFNFLQMIECDKLQGFFVSEAVMPDIVRRSYTPSDGVEDVA